MRVVVESGIKIATNQVSFSLLDARAAGAMSAYCLEHDIKLLCFGTLLGGFLTEKWLGAEPPEEKERSTWSLMKYYRYIEEWAGAPTSAEAWNLIRTLTLTLTLTL